MKHYILNTRLFPDQTAVFYLGQLGFLLKFQDKYIMIDGYLTDYVDKNFSNDLVTWVRNYPTPIQPEELDFLDYVFCTHAHGDHADPETLTAITRVNSKAKFVVSKAISSALASMGIPEDRIIGLSCDQKTVLDADISVIAVPAAHEELHMDEHGEYLETGFLIEAGPLRMYHSGDCCPYKGLEERIMNCDIFMVPVNGRDYYRTQVCDIIGCFDSREALTLAKNTGANMLFPAHFDLYDVNCINPAQFVDEQQKVNPKQKYHIFMPGERYIYTKED